MTLNLNRLIWTYLWDFLIEMSSKELKEFPDITVAVCNEWFSDKPRNPLVLGRDMTWPDSLEPGMLDGTLMRDY